MDSLTHLVLGASLGYALFHRRLGRTAAAAGGLAAVSPDIDIFVRSATDPLLAIELHRGFTHGLAFAPVGAAIVAALWLVRRRWRHLPEWSTLCLCGIVAWLSHSLLDAATSYGTRLWWPFSDHRESWDLISIVDPPFTLILLCGLAWALRDQRIRPAVTGLAAAALYVMAGGVQHARALATVEALAASRGHRLERVEAMPTLANNVIWRTVYLHEGRIHADRVRAGWFSAPTVREGWSLPVVRASDLTPEEQRRNARRSFERFAWFSDDWIARSPADATFLGDMRYSLSAEAFDPIWGIRFTPMDAPAEVAWVNRTRDRQLGVRPLWDEISGADPRFKPR